MFRKALVIAAVLLISLAATAQENRSVISVQATGFLTNETNRGADLQDPTQSTGFLASYRFQLTERHGVEGNYGFTRNSQRYLIGGVADRVRSNVHEITGAYVFSLPGQRLRPFVLAGGGVLIFDPLVGGTTVSGADSQAKGAFLYGGGVDFGVTSNVALRVGYRGLVYKAPDFETGTLDLDKVTHTAQPTAGFVFRF